MAYKFLVIQTAFTGDVVLATGIVEALRRQYPGTQIDFLLRKGNEGLLQNHPYITNLLTWDKKTGKNRNLLKIAMQIRKERYTHVINPHRFGSSGFITLLSGAAYRAGFDKNPFSFCYTKKVKHIISEPYAENPVREVERNHALIAGITTPEASCPKLYPTKADYEAIDQYLIKPYVCIAPASVWFTKQFPAEQWVAMMNELPADYRIYIIGAPSDNSLAETILTSTNHPYVTNLCGKLSFLQSAALMQGADMNYTNDSAPLHFASALNAPATAVFCSTVPAFGFGPLRNNGRVVEVKERLTAAPAAYMAISNVLKGISDARRKSQTNNFMVDIEHDIKSCVSVLQQGGTILYPTETVWGIGCDALNEAAVEKIFTIKQRPKEKSMIVLLADARDVLQYVAAPPPDIIAIIESFDRPTTVIYDGALGFPDNVVNKDGSIAIRVTTDPFCKALIKRFRKPLVSTSANLSGEPTPSTYAMIGDAIISNVDYTVRHRQDDNNIASPSRIVRINDDGELVVIRG